MEDSLAISENEITSNIGFPVIPLEHDSNPNGIYKSICSIASICKSTPVYDQYCQYVLPSQWKEIIEYVDENF